MYDFQAFIAEAAVRLFRNQYGFEVREADSLSLIGIGKNASLPRRRKYGITTIMPEDNNELYYCIYADCIRGSETLPNVSWRRPSPNISTAWRFRRYKRALGNTAPLGMDPCHTQQIYPILRGLFGRR